MKDELNISWDNFRYEVTKLAERVNSRFNYVYGVPTGGSFVAMELAKVSNLQMVDIETDMDNISISEVLVVDDLVDSGRTLEKYREDGYPCEALFRKSHSPKDIAPQALELDGWIKFPWEHDTGPMDAVTRILSFIGEDPNRVGLKDTPERVVRMWGEVFRGYNPDKAPKKTCFPNNEDGIHYDQMIVDKGYFHSFCEHHMLPFFGRYWFAYIPGDTIIGLSKIPDWIDYHAAKLQIQERLVADVLNEIGCWGKHQGMALVLEGRHLCKEMRDVKKYDSTMITADLRGALRDDAMARAEFMRFVG